MEFTTFQPLWFLLLLGLLYLGLRFSLVDRPRPLQLASFTLRALGVLLLVLALCRPYVATEGQKLHAVFMVDVSESIDLAAAQDAVDEVEQSIAALQPGDSHSLFMVGNGVRATTPDALRETLENWQNGIADDAFRSASQLADGMLATRLAFPAGKARRIVLFSDGQETAGDLEGTLRTLEEEQTDLRFQQVDSISQPEASIVSLEPNTPFAYQGEVVRMKVQVAVNAPMSARLRMLHKGVAVQEKPLQLEEAGVHDVWVDVPMDSAGAAVWKAELLAEKDFFPINNQAATTITVRGQPRLLILHQDPREMRALSRALKEQDFEVDVRGNRGLPESMDGLLSFDAIMIADMPATDMSPRQMELLRRYVTDFGGGLVMTGSENAFGLGGYYKTPVEEVLPLISRFEKEKEKPSLAMVLVMDKSGSMSGVPIELARQAAKAAVELLSPRDQIAVIGFDGSPQIISEMRSAAEKDTIQVAIDSMAAGGGTFLFPAMQVGQEMLDQSVSKVKHMIVLTDGQTQGADHIGLTQDLADSGVTVSTVALGDGAARELLASIAEVGRGRYYETMDPANVPQIFTRETMQASKSAIKEDLYALVQVGDHPMLAGYSEEELPFSLGYVMAEPKPTAQLLLVAETGDPMLAVGRFGLGGGLAFTSDLTERWGAEWLAWEETGQFWAQALRSIMRKSDAEGMQIQEDIASGTWNLRIERRDPNRQPVSRITWDAEALDENGTMHPVDIRETGLGTYAASVPLESHRQLTLRLRDRESEKVKILHYHAPYPNEYRLGADLPAAVAKLSDYEIDTLREGIIPIQERRPIGNWLAIVALGCLCSGVLLRRV